MFEDEAQTKISELRLSSEGISPQLQRWSCQVFTIPKTIAAIAHLPNLAVGGIENISPKRYVYKLSGNQTWQLKILRKRVLGR